MENYSAFSIEAKFQAERRKNRQEIAKDVMLSMIPVFLERGIDMKVDSIARCAVRMADALIKELDK